MGWGRMGGEWRGGCNHHTDRRLLPLTTHGCCLAPSPHAFFLGRVPPPTGVLNVGTGRRRCGAERFRSSCTSLACCPTRRWKSSSTLRRPSSCSCPGTSHEGSVNHCCSPPPPPPPSSRPPSPYTASAAREVVRREEREGGGQLRTSTAPALVAGMSPPPLPPPPPPLRNICGGRTGGGRRRRPWVMVLGRPVVWLWVSLCC